VDAVELPNQQTAAHLGDTVALGGAQFDGADQILLLSLPRLDIEQAIAPPSAVAADRIEFVIPDQPTDYPAGNYSMALQVGRPGESQPRTTEQVSLRIAPRITSLVSPPQVFPRGNDDDHVAIVTLSCSPEVRPTQRVSLIIGSREVVADDHPATTADLAFTVRDAPLGVHYVRLRVDGVDSQLVDRGKSPPAYFDHRIEIA
jgi:hypothetical protein